MLKYVPRILQCQYMSLAKRLTARLGVRVVCQISSYPILGGVLVTHYTGTHSMNGQVYDVRMHRLIQWCDTMRNQKRRFKTIILTATGG